MRSFLPIAICFLVGLSSARAADFYWKGGVTGDFNDPNMWWVGSFASGTTASQSPISTDNVYFVSAAFPTSGLFVDVTSNASCGSMYWDASILAANKPTLRCTNASLNLDVHGDFALSPNMIWKFNGNIRFTSVQPAGTVHTIKTSGIALLVNSVVFEASNLVEYRLLDDLFVDDPAQAAANLTEGGIVLNGGYWNTNGKAVRTESVTSMNNNVKRRLNISNSRLTLTRYHDQYAWRVDFDGLAATPNFSGFNSAGSHIIQNGYYYTRMRFGRGIKYDSITFDTEAFTPIGDQTAFVYLDLQSSYDRDTFEHMFAKRQVSLIYENRKLIIKNLYLYPQSVFSAYSSPKTIEVENIINYAGCNDFPTLGASAKQGWIEQLTIKKISAGNLAMNNVIVSKVLGDVAGGRSYTATNSVDQGGNTNITITGGVGREMYFRAGVGNQDWHNLANWRDENAGVYTPSACLPTPFDNVYFDGSSFNASNRVEFTQRAYCKDMRWLATIPNNAQLRAGNMLRVYGHLEYDPKMTFGNITGVGGNYRYILLSGPSHTVTTKGAVNNNISVIIESYADYTFVGNYSGLITGGQWSRMRMGADTLRPYNGFSMHYGNFAGTQIYITSGSWAFHQKDHGATAITYSGNSTVHWQHTSTGTYYSFYGGYLPNLIVYTRMPVNYNNMYIRGNLTLKENAVFYTGNTQYAGNTNGALRVIGGLNGAAGDVTMEAGSQLVLTSFGTTNSLVNVAGSFTAIGNCQKNVFIGTHDGAPLQGGFSVAGATNITFATIQGLPNISPAPNTTIAAVNSIDAGNNTNWSFVSGASQTFYWRAKRGAPTNFVGDWSDPGYWTTNPANLVGDSACMPSAVDDVVFDALSFSPSSNQCNITSIERCRDVSVTAAARITVGNGALYCRHLRFTHSNARLDGTLGSGPSPSQIYIAGDLQLAPTMTQMFFRGDIIMNGNGNITSNNTKLQARELVFNNNGGAWYLQDALFLDNDWATTNTGNRRAGAMTISAGNLYTNSHPVTISSYFNSSNGTYNRGLHLGSTIFTHRATAWYYIYWTTSLWNVTATRFTLTSNPDAQINFLPSTTFNSSLTNTRLDYYMGNGLNYPKVSIIDSDQPANLYGNANYNYLQLEANIYIDGNNAMDSLRLEGGYFYRFRNASTQTLNAPHGHIISNGTSSDFVNIESSTPGAQFTLRKPYGPAFCIDFVKVKDCNGTKETNMALVPTTPTNYQTIHPFLEFQTGVNSDNIGGTATGIWAFNLPVLVTPQYAGSNVVQPCAISYPASFDVPVTGTGPYLVNYTWNDGSNSGSNTINAPDDDNNSSTPAYVTIPVHSANAVITYTFNVTTFRCGEETTPIPRTITLQQKAPNILTQTAQSASCTFTNGPQWITLFGNIDDRPVVSLQDYTGPADLAALGTVTSNVFFDPTVQQVNIGGFLYPYLQRHWQITPTNNGPANVRIYFTQTELNALLAASSTYGAFTNASQLQIVRYPSGSIGVGPEQIIPYTIIPLTGAAAAPFSTTTNVYAFEFAVPSFSHFIITPSHDILLDNNLLDFTAEKYNHNQVELKWTVQNSTDVATYTIERSHDGINAYTIAELVSHHQSATDYYQTIDANPRYGTNYYRLRAQHLDGQSSFSDWRAVDIGGPAHATKVFPNPASDHIFIQLPNPTNAQIRLFNTLGQLVAAQTFDQPLQTHTLSLADLPAGIYTLQILLDDHSVSTHQITKK